MKTTWEILIMNDTQQAYTMKLIEQAKKVGLLDSNLTLDCIVCKAIFPKEYDKCPQCNTGQIQLNFVGLINNHS